MASVVSKTVRQGCFLLLLMLTAQPVPAQSNAQGLRWGFEAGDVFEYEWTVYDETSTWPMVLNWSERVRVEIEALPTIPADVESIQDLSYQFSDFGKAYFANGTTVAGSFSWTALPIGNWPLITTLFLDYFKSYGYDNANVSLSPTVCKLECDFATGPEYWMTWAMEFLASSGVVSYLDLQVAYINPLTEEEIVSRIKLAMIPPSAVPVFVTVTLGAAMVATILVIEIHRRRRTTMG